MVDLYNKLTPSARTALKDICTEFSNRLLSEAYSSAKLNNTEDSEISLRDVIEARARIENNNQRDNGRNIRRKKMYLACVYMGVVYALVGVLVFELSSRSFNNLEFAGIIVAALGLLVAFSAFFLYKTGFGQPVVSKYEERKRLVVDLWGRIEELGGKMFMKNNNGKLIDNVSQLIDHISLVLGDPDGGDKLKSILKVRNAIIKGSMDSLSPTRVEETLELEYEIIDKLRKQSD